MDCENCYIFAVFVYIYSFGLNFWFSTIINIERYQADWVGVFVYLCIYVCVSFLYSYISHLLHEVGWLVCTCIYFVL